eukprot:NODE_488_length_7780_cov_0.211691.p2 type:complete len:422 gc:universal NODE_488_length_7780_cov_0.211691:2526-3791(+)
MGLTHLSRRPSDLELGTFSEIGSQMRKMWIETMKTHIRRQWLVLGLIVTILFAYLVPNLGKNNGYLKTNLWTNSLAIVLIFLISGLSIQSQILRDALYKVHLHVLIQLINLGLIPLYTFGLVYLLELTNSIDKLLLEGILVLSVMPATVSTCIVYTQLAKGNTALAIIDSAFGNFIGIFISPLYLILIEKKDIRANYGSLILNLTLLVILPFLIGQTIRIFLPGLTKKICRLPGFKQYTGILVLLMVWTAFSTAFSANIIIGISVFYTFLITILLYVINLSLTALIFMPLNGLSFNANIEEARDLIEVGNRFSWKVTKEDVIAALCTVPQKTMAMGLPLIQLVYYDRPNDIAVVGLPLIMYHAVQLFLNGLLIPIMKKYKDDFRDQSIDSSDEESVLLDDLNDVPSTDYAHFDEEERSPNK